MSGTTKHFGSLYTMADYTTKVHNIFVNASYAASSTLRLFSTFIFNQSTAAYDEIDFPAVSDLVAQELSHQDFTFEETPTYSDIDFSLIRVSAGAEYWLTPMISLTVDGEYADLTDDAPYVYGDESGSMFIIRSGFRFTF